MSTLVTHAAAAPTCAAEKRPSSPKLSTSTSGIGAADSSFGPSENSATVVGETKPKAITISVEVRGWLGTSVETVSLNRALKKGLITTQEAIQKGYCSQEYLISRGYGIVKFSFTSSFGTALSYEGTLRTALKNRYITIEDAIRQNYITRAQAIEGGLLKTNK